MHVPFNRPYSTGKELAYIEEAIGNHYLSGDGPFGKRCQKWLEDSLHVKKVLLTPSGTAALEMMALLLDLREGDEVIMPSFTFVSTANAFALRGAKPVFVDINPDTINIDETLIRQAITKRTKAIVPVHYAGVGCEMDSISSIAREFDLPVLEDAAHGVLAKYRTKFLGSIGQMAALSFHETKNLICGEGGAILLNDDKFIERAEIIREKGTNRSIFFRGQVDKYRWMDIGSSYLPSELQCAYLWAQLEKADQITSRRLAIWQFYQKHLTDLSEAGMIALPVVPQHCEHNGHLFYIKVSNPSDRDPLLSYLKERDIGAMFHYVPLHTAPASAQYCRVVGNLSHTETIGESLIRLPFFNEISESQQLYVVSAIRSFYEGQLLASSRENISAPAPTLKQN